MASKFPFATGATMTRNLTGSNLTRFAALGLLIVTNTPVLAETSIIRTPPVAALAPISTEATLHELVLANLVATNCKLSDVTHGDAALIAGTAQTVAEQLGVSTEIYFSMYVNPAMLEIAGPEGCAQHAGAARAMVGHLKELGGEVLEE
ncbi:hypothetical protein JJJ17_07220 [Paracoccus caeni]|uniref:Uncharacterized protein n=1 Tax=Paracoccus caeni TaxID=657651 RepID=A0A934SE55_9RHOB|nr:hypothetical protein [Paracoccus caeni]MBK4215710.1 hypothetical protein [Paracoccus caeni]